MMSKATPERARQEDLEQLKELLSEAVPDCAPQTVWELPWSWQHYHVIRDVRGNIVATGALLPRRDGKMELRGITVHPRFRGFGLAAGMISHLIERARKSGCALICITSKDELFARFGFQQVPSMSCFEWHRMRPERPSTGRVVMALAEDQPYEHRNEWYDAI